MLKQWSEMTGVQRTLVVLLLGIGIPLAIWLAYSAGYWVGFN